MDGWMELILKDNPSFVLVLTCLHLADPATFLATNSVLVTLFSSESSLFIQFTMK